MAILKFDNTVAGWVQINDLPDPKYPIISGARVTVRRTDAKVNQMRLATGWSNALLDNIFVAGSGLDP